LALPAFPFGWSADTRRRLLDFLDVKLPPVCPPELREELLAREKAGRPLVPPRIARQIKARLIREYQFQVPAAELARVPLCAIARRIAEVDAGTVLRGVLQIL
jgi:hypothetical protein